MRLPIERKLKKRLHLNVARLQDEVVDALYSAERGAVIHGGTAIWRCFSGNRFSEDLDFYSSRPKEIETGLPAALERRGFSLPKFKKTENLFFARISDGGTDVRLEVNFSAKKKAVPTPFERTDGSFMEVLCLSPADLLVEKIEAYEARRFIRDAYDVLHLSSYATSNAEIRQRVQRFLRNCREPVDEPDLKAIVYSGAVPSFEQIRTALEARFA